MNLCYETLFELVIRRTVTYFITGKALAISAVLVEFLQCLSIKHTLLVNHANQNTSNQSMMIALSISMSLKATISVLLIQY